MFESQTPGIAIELLHTPSDFNNRLLTMVAAGTPPDTFVLDMQVAAAFAHFVVDQAPYAERTPEIIYELLDWGILRLLSLNQDAINAVISEELGRMWRNEQPVQTAADSLAARVHALLQQQ